uniref:Uncharacterized protein n=1 Tax=Arundo donax TaxID=35708 RepID=A0A0A8YK87_ARUDO
MMHSDSLRRGPDRGAATAICGILLTGRSDDYPSEDPVFR